MLTSSPLAAARMIKEDGSSKGRWGKSVTMNSQSCDVGVSWGVSFSCRSCACSSRLHSPISIELTDRHLGFAEQRTAHRAWITNHLDSAEQRNGTSCMNHSEHLNPADLEVLIDLGLSIRSSHDSLDGDHRPRAANAQRWSVGWKDLIAILILEVAI